MAKVIAFCGLSCTECDAFPANQKKMTADEKIRVTEKWSMLYGHGHTIKPEDINCDGCLSEDGRLWSRCNDCPIRKCGQEKQVKNCAYCADYACKNLDEFFAMVPSAKVTLEEIRKNR
jgi:hypothetical protein